MKAAYKIYPSENLVVYAVSGVPSLTEIKAFFSRLSDDPEFGNGLVGLADYRNARAFGKPKEVVDLGKFLLKELKTDCEEWVTLVSNPMTTAFTIIFGGIVASHFGIQVCSTEKRASELVGKDVTPFLHELHHTPECWVDYTEEAFSESQ